jgi:hypothetical protein
VNLVSEVSIMRFWKGSTTEEETLDSFLLVGIYFQNYLSVWYLVIGGGSS